MGAQHAARIGEAASKLTALPEEDLPVVLEFLDALERRTSPPSSLPVAQIRELAKARAQRLAHVPRDILMARFLELAEDIRQQVIARGTAVDGDWTSD
jgi:hypothetical protein